MNKESTRENSSSTYENTTDSHSRIHEQPMDQTLSREPEKNQDCDQNQEQNGTETDDKKTPLILDPFAGGWDDERLFNTRSSKIIQSPVSRLFDRDEGSSRKGSKEDAGNSQNETPFHSEIDHPRNQDRNPDGKRESRAKLMSMIYGVDIPFTGTAKEDTQVLKILRKARSRSVVLPSFTALNEDKEILDKDVVRNVGRNEGIYNNGMLEGKNPNGHNECSDEIAPDENQGKEEGDVVAALEGKKFKKNEADSNIALDEEGNEWDKKEQLDSILHEEQVKEDSIIPEDGSDNRKRDTKLDSLPDDGRGKESNVQQAHVISEKERVKKGQENEDSKNKGDVSESVIPPPKPPLPPPPPGSLGKQPLNVQNKQLPKLNMDRGALLSEIINRDHLQALRKVNVPKKEPVEQQESAYDNVLKKTTAKPREMSKEEIEQIRGELLIELLGYMEAPAGNLEELMEKCKEISVTIRGFIYTLVRRDWVVALRVVKFASKKKPKKKGEKCKNNKEANDEDKDAKQQDKSKTSQLEPIFVWPGKEWSDVIQLPDVTDNIEKKLRKKGSSILLTGCHVYRFDNNSKKHLLDKIILIKGKRFPKEVEPFDEPAPPKPVSLNEIRSYEEWESRKTMHEQCDWAQYNLIYNKLVSFDSIIVMKFSILNEAVSSLHKMGEKLRRVFKNASIEEMREVIDQIPEKIKEITTRVQNDSGVIIRDSDLKLTPEFLSNYNPRYITPGP